MHFDFLRVDYLSMGLKRDGTKAVCERGQQNGCVIGKVHMGSSETEPRRTENSFKVGGSKFKEMSTLDQPFIKIYASIFSHFWFSCIAINDQELWPETLLN